MRDASAELLDGARQPGEFVVPVRLRLELPQLLFELLLTPLQITPAPPVFVQHHHTRQVGFGQAFDLLSQARLATPQPLLARLQLLRQPVPAVRTRQRLGDLRGLGQQRAKVGPHQLVEPPRRAQARRTLLLPAREQGGQLARTGIVAVTMVRGPSQARQPTHAAADQAAQQVGVGLVVALREAPIAGQPRLHEVELLLADDGRDLGDQDPLLAWHVDPAPRRALAWGGGGASLQCAPTAPAVAVDRPGVGRVGQQSPDTGEVPAGQPRRCLDPVLLEPARQRAEAVRLLRVPGEHLAHDGGFGLLDAHAGRVARTVRIDTVAEGSSCPRQHQPRLQLAPATAAHALGDQRTLILRHRTTDLQQ